MLRVSVSSRNCKSGGSTPERHRDAAIVLGDDIDAAADVAALARAWAKMPAMVASLLAEEVGARDITGVIACELGALTRRAGELAEMCLASEGMGAPPCAYALLVLGSAGRGESLLALDQDHALVFEHGEPNGPEDRWFAAFGKHVSDILHEVGVPYCKGGVMSANTEFRGSMRTWRERIARWIERARPQDLLNVDIFYDFRPVYGDGPLASVLWDEAWSAARGHSAFLKLLAEAGAVEESPFGMLGRLRRVHAGGLRCGTNRMAAARRFTFAGCTRGRGSVPLAAGAFVLSQAAVALWAGGVAGVLV